MKCPFCVNPCGNEHCPYQKEEEEDSCDKKIKGLEEENKRLKDQLLELIKWMGKGKQS